MKTIEKNILLALIALAFSLGVVAAIGTSFCSSAAILFLPAFAPILAFAIYKLIKLNVAKKTKNLNK